MNYDIETRKGEVKIDFTITAQEWEGYLDKAYQKTKARYKVPGFRPGHASRKTIERLYGQGTFFDDAFNDAFYASYSRALDEHDEIFPVDDPKVDFGGIEESGVSFSATVTVKPEVTLGAYTGIKVPAVEYNVKAEDVEAELDRAVKQASRKVDVTDRAVMKDDIVNLDYSGSVDGVKFEGGTASGQDLTIGSGAFIPGFEDQMIGMNVGESKDITVTFPEDYHEKSLAGKEAVFAVTVNKISVMQAPALNDEFAKDVSKFDTLAEYKADIEARLKGEAARRTETENENALVEAVVKGAQIDVPQCMVDREVDDLIHDMEYRLSYMYRGMTLADYLKYTGGTMEELRKGRAAEAEHNIRIRLTLEAIVKAENLAVTDEEYEAEIAKNAETAGKSVEEYKKQTDERTAAYIRNNLLSKKLVDFLKANNTFEVKKSEEKTAEKANKKPAAKKPAAKKADK